MRIYIDFESRSQADIWKTGAWTYSAHPTTEILCMAYAIDDEPVQLLNRVTFAANVQHFNKLIATPDAEFHAFNAFFEQAMWINEFSKYGFSPIPIKQWRCTQAKGMAHGLPKQLEKAALALELKHKKDMAGSRIMKKIASSTGVIAQQDLDALYQYCIQDVEVEREMDKRLPDLAPREQKLWFLDQYINQTGVKIDVEAVNIANECIERENERLTAELNRLTNGQITAGTERGAIQSWLADNGVTMENMQKQTVANAIAQSSGDIQRVLFLRQQLSMTSNAKYKVLQESQSDGRIRDLLMFHGAQTGRWGGKMFQVQNLPKPKIKDFDSIRFLDLLVRGGYDAVSLIYGDDLLNALSSAIRSCLIPDIGHEMFISDFAAIEPRVLFWLADEQVGLQMFHDQDADPAVADIYVHMARNIYSDKTLTKKDKLQRQLGKQAVLGCGYGMGSERFLKTCASYDIDIDIVLATRSVNSYRRIFSKVTDFWKALDLAAKQCVISKRPQQVGKVLFYMDGEWLRLKLPMGRTIVYHHPKIVDGEFTCLGLNGVTNKYEIETKWGGIFAENVTQAVARDIMAEAMFTLASTGFQILFTVHDELVVQAKKGTKTVDDVLSVMRVTPGWAKGCPINAECDKVERYKK